MKEKINLILIIYYLLNFLACKVDENFKTNIILCNKEIEFKKVSTNQSSSKLDIYHHGFCYNYLDTIHLQYQYISGRGILLSDTTIDLSVLNVRFYDKNDNGTFFTIPFYPEIDTAHHINVKITGIYNNSSKTNKIDTFFQTNCIKKIENVKYTIIGENSCQTSLGNGNEYWVEFYHSGFCLDYIDTIKGYGDFYDFDGYIWNSSRYNIPKARITTLDSTLYNTKIEHRVCVTWSFSDYVKINFRIKYKDGTFSNSLNYNIYRQGNVYKEINTSEKPDLK